MLPRRASRTSLAVLQGVLSCCAASVRGGAYALARRCRDARFSWQGQGALAGGAAYDQLQRGDPAPLSPERRAPRRRRRLAKLLALLRRGLRRRWT